MSLKSLIQRLLDSRTTPSEAGHNAMPSSAPTTISSPTSITSWGTITTFTAPDDGYVTFRGRSMVGSAAQIASLPLENNPTIITATQDNYQGMSCNLPVVKGKTVEVYGSNIENIVVSFNRLIGGGYSFLVRRALSCLRPSFNYLLKSSYRTNPNGSDIRLCRATVCNSTQQSLGMSRLLTDGSEFTRTRTLPLMSLSLREGWLWRGSQQLKRLELPAEQVALFLLQRVRDLSLLLSLGSLKFGFHQLTAPQVNFAVGGASC